MFNEKQKYKPHLLTIALSFIFGTFALIIVYAEVHFTIPGTTIITDPREVFVLVGSAITGPIGASIIGLLSSLYDPTPGVKYFVIAQHVWGASWVGFLYRKYIYQKLEMPSFLLGWNLLVIAYYYLLDIPVFGFVYQFMPEFYFILTGSMNSFWAVLYNIHIGWFSEVIFTCTITSLIFIATPKRYRKPIWSDSKGLESVESKSRLFRALENHFLKRNYLGIRIGLWYLILSLIPFFIVLLFINNNVKTSLLEVESEKLLGNSKLFSEIYDQKSTEINYLTIRFESQNYIFTNYSKSDSVAINNLIEKIIIPSKKLLAGKSFLKYLNVNNTIAAGIYRKKDNIFITTGDSEQIELRLKALEKESANFLTISILLISIVGGLLIILIVVRPIHNLTATAEEVSEGNYETLTNPELADDEIKILAESFNSMITNVKNSYKKLKDEIDHRKKVELNLIQARRKAEESEKLKSEFLAQMSHEIRTPVNSILNFTAIIKEETFDKVSEELKESFSIVENSGRRLIRTIDSILDLSQLQLGNFEVKTTKFDSVTATKEVVKEFISIAKNKNLKIIFDEQSEDCFIYADRYSFSQIVANLVDNAIKYTSKGHVKINCDHDYETFTLNIEDTGIGISEDNLELIFEPFSQEDTGYTRKFDGNGLGLTLVKKYCEINKAELIVRSQKGVGSTFSVTFKRANKVS